MYLVSKQPRKNFNTPFNRYNSTQTTNCAIRGAKIKIKIKKEKWNTREIRTCHY